MWCRRTTRDGTASRGFVAAQPSCWPLLGHKGRGPGQFQNLEVVSRISILRAGWLFFHRSQGSRCPDFTFLSVFDVLMRLPVVWSQADVSLIYTHCALGVGGERRQECESAGSDGRSLTHASRGLLLRPSHEEYSAMKHFLVDIQCVFTVLLT